MKTVGAFAAKTHLSQLLDEVARGERITITRHGQPVAQLVPLAVKDKPTPQEAFEKWLAIRKAHNVTLGPGLTLRDLIEEGRRY